MNESLTDDRFSSNIVRSVARFFYCMIKPIVMPIAFRFREFIIGDLRQALDRIDNHSTISAQRVAIPCGQDEVLLRSVSGYLLCPANDVTALSCLIEARGDPEKGTRLVIERVLRPGDVFVDVGAHLGIHTLAAARAMQRCGKIIALEPCESTCNFLRRTVHMNGLADITEIQQAAISNVTGELPFYLAMGSPQHSLYSFGSSGFSNDSVMVNAWKLDDILLNQPVINLIKIDVEGAETDVIEGAALTLQRFPDIALIVEFGPTHLKRVGSKTTQEWLDVFTQFGLMYRVINEATGGLENWTPTQLEGVDIVNLFFAREGSSAWERVQMSKPTR
ncbi:MAG: FkbM family methyltransferase [Gammaproteobacteria bacterium]